MALFDDIDPKAGTSLTTPTGSGLFDNLPEAPGPIASGLKTGVAGVKSAAGGLVSLAGRGFGVKGLETAGEEITTAANKDAAMYSRRAEDVKSIGDAVDFAQYGIASALPSMLTMLAGAGTGRLVGGMAARKVTEDATRRLIQKSGMAGGAVGTTIGLEAGSIYPEAVKEGVDSPVARSIVGGVAAGALDVVPEFYLARKLGLLGGAGRAAGVGRGVNALKTGATSAVLEGAAEGGQTVIERVAAGQPLGDDDARSDYLNSVLVGLLAGGTFGGAAGALAPVQNTPENIQDIPNVSTNQGNVDTTPLPGIDLNATYPPVQPQVVEPPSPYGTINTDVTLPPPLRTVDQVLADKQAALQAPRDEAAARVAALEAELAAPPAQRQGRTKGSITKELMAARAQLDTASKALQAVENEIIGQQVTNLRRTPRGSLTEGAEINLPQEPVVTDGPINPPSIPVDLTDRQRQAFAVQTTPFERPADKVATLQGTPLVELPEGSPQSAPQQQPLVVPDTPTYSSSRGVLKQGTSAQKQRAFIDNSLQAVDAQTKTLVDSGALPVARASKIRDALSKGLESVFDGTKDPAQVRDKIESVIAKAVKGRINKTDAETFTDQLLAQIAGQPQEFLSKGGIEKLAGTKVVDASGQPLKVFHGTKAKEPITAFSADKIGSRTDPGFMGSGFYFGDSKTASAYAGYFPSSDPDRAPDGGSVYPVYLAIKNPLEIYGKLEGKRIKDRGVLAREAVGLPKSATAKELRSALEAQGYDGVIYKDDLGSQEYVAFRPEQIVNALTFDSKAPTTQTPDQLASTGRKIYSELQRLLGDPADVEVRLFEQRDPNGFAGRYRPNEVKDIIELATNAKDALSVAAHEAFHRIETKHLSAKERAVLRRGLKKGTPLYNRVIEAARRYDAANQTNIASEVESVPEEARAYGFEMWRRGELEVEGTLQKVFVKIQQLLERVKNYISGLGFNSVEDIYRAVDMGRYAKDGANPLMALDATEAYKFVDEAFESNAALATSLQEVADFAKSGSAEPTQVTSMWAKAIDGLELPKTTAKDLLGAQKDAFAGGLTRAYLTHISSGMNLARQSVGFKNAFDVITSYEQRKNRLIAEGVDVNLKTWQDRGTSNDNIQNVSKALLNRTVDGARVGTPEYDALFQSLNETERKMFKEATDMIASQLDAEFVADQRSMRAALGEESDAYKEWLENRAAQVQRLKDEGYVPERRYGDHVVYASIPYTNAQGKTVEMTVLREQFESQAEANVRLKQYQEALGGTADLKVQYGFRYSPEHDASLSYQQFLDLARRFDIDISQAEKERLAKAMISADSVRRNRIFRRKNVAGYSEDGLRVLSEFAVTMANKIAYSEFSSAIADAQQGKVVTVSSDQNRQPVVSVDQESNLWAQDGPNAGFLRQRTDDMVDFVLQPQRGGEWSRTARMAASLHFLGGSLGAAVVQVSSLPMVTMPYLSQFSSSYTDAHAKVVSGFMTAVKNSDIRDIEKLQNPNVRIPGVDEVAGLRQALARAAEDGTTMDTEIYQIMGQSRGSMLSKSRNARRALEAWMYPFRESEKVNRAATFIAAYRIGAENKLQGDKLYEFARDAVYNTQNRYDEANRSALARNPIWAILFTFKSFPIFMTETIYAMHKQSPKAAVFMLLSLAMAAGINGLPFSEDLQDIVDTIAQRLFNSPFNSQRAMKNVLKNASEAIVGTDLSGLFLNGAVNELTGLSFASRVGLGNLIPGTRIFAADNDYKRTAQEMLGPVASQVIGGFEALESLSKGDFVKAVRQGAPLAVQNAVKGAEQWTSGYAQDVRGRKLVDVSGFEALMQSIGLSSSAVNQAYQLDRIDKQTVAFYQMVRQDFTNDIVKAVRDNEPGKIEDVMRSVNAWNASHPEMPIVLNPSNIRRTVAEAGLPINQRTLMTLPKQLRASSEAYELTRNQ